MCCVRLLFNLFLIFCDFGESKPTLCKHQSHTVTQTNEPNRGGGRRAALIFCDAKCLLLAKQWCVFKEGDIWLIKQQFPIRSERMNWYHFSLQPHFITTWTIPLLSSCLGQLFRLQRQKVHILRWPLRLKTQQHFRKQQLKSLCFDPQGHCTFLWEQYVFWLTSS